MKNKFEKSEIKGKRIKRDWKILRAKIMKIKYDLNLYNPDS
jgi:hypothetical protein